MSLVKLTDALAYAVPNPIRSLKHESRWPKLVIRTALIGLGALAVYKGACSADAAYLIGSAVSLPAAVMAKGAVLAYEGFKIISVNWAGEQFKGLAKGLLLLASGYFLVEHHREFRFWGMNENNFHVTGRGFLEDQLSKLHGFWVMCD